MTIRIAVCDDELVQTEYLSALVSKWAARDSIGVSVQAFPSAEAFLFAYADDKSFDILLLDIQMKDMNGVELAKEIRKANETLQIVFITAFPDFVAHGYDVSALHYLMKPVSESKLFEVLTKAARGLQKAARTILLPISGGNVRIPADEIVYAEAFPHHVTLHTTEKRQDFPIRFGDMEKLLGEGFIRCHRSYIVNVKHVRRVTRKALLLHDSLEIPLSRSRYDEVNQAFIRFK